MVAINRFQCDTDAELHFIQEFCESLGAEFALTEVFAKGGAGGKELAEKVCKTIETKPSDFHVLYDTELSVEEKVEKIAKEIYRADGVTFTAPAKIWIIIMCCMCDYALFSCVFARYFKKKNKYISLIYKYLYKWHRF